MQPCSLTHLLKSFFIAGTRCQLMIFFVTEPVVVSASRMNSLNALLACASARTATTVPPPPLSSPLAPPRPVQAAQLLEHQIGTVRDGLAASIVAPLVEISEHGSSSASKHVTVHPAHSAIVVVIRLKGLKARCER